jgi:hypothetical protein
MKINRDESLKLLGLFTLATDYYRKCREAEIAINRTLGRDEADQGHLSDAIYSGDSSISNFYAALKKDGIELELIVSRETMTQG